MKETLKVTLLLVMIMILNACQDTRNSRPYLINKKEGVNPNSLAYRVEDKVLDRKNKIEMAQIAANSKLEVAKIESVKAVQIAKINSQTQKELTEKTENSKIEISKIDSKTKDKKSMITLYIAIGFLLSLIIGFILWYRYKKRTLEIEAKLEEKRLQHQLLIKEKELQETRMQKVLDLAISGQLPPEIQQDVLQSLTYQGETSKSKVIESN